MSENIDAPVSQLFLSCDLTGSTNFKQRPGLPEPWQKVFLQFYREFPQRVATTQVWLDTEHLAFDLWKPVGDELIYSCNVQSEDDIYWAVRTWVQSMRDYELNSLDDTPMGTKGGAFIATFPGPDSRSSVPRNPTLESSDADVVELNRRAYADVDHGNYLYDYFGPSIDTGFRVLSRCSSRYFTLSVEVALAMLGKSFTPGLDRKTFEADDLSLLEFVELKGVWGGRKYPIVAIDTEFGDPVNQAFFKMGHRSSAAELHELCEACYASQGWPSRLYLPKSSNEHFTNLPVDPLEGHLSTTSAGAEKTADDEPIDARELEDDAPLGPGHLR